MAEAVYVIQPVEGANSQVLHEEVLSLIESAGGEYAGTIYQKIREIDPATYVGEGKLQELYERIGDLELTVLFNGELTPSQTVNISKTLGGKKVIDRTTLILDIFALRAVSSEGKLQVELAQLKYLYPRLRGKGSELSRLGGGIGTRGPGESKLETDRRHIRARIRALEGKLEELEKRRGLRTERRKKERVKTVALVGYTNTGKSTLMNALTGADVFVQDALFATLDPTARTFTAEDVPFLLVDTVGFLQSLPHQLVEAFHSTLDAALNCDLALVVCDGTGDYEMQKQTTMQTLEQLGFSSPVLFVMNKCDVAKNALFPREFIPISAKTGTGLEGLKRKIFEALQDDFAIAHLFIPYKNMAEYAPLRPLLTERKTTFTDDGEEVDAVIPKIYADRFKPFLKK